MNYQRDCDNSAWATCTPGTLNEVAVQLRAARRRARVKHAMTPLLVLTMLTAGVWSTTRLIDSPLTDSLENNSSDIACSEVRTHLEFYASGQLPAALSENIVAHLQHCPSCRAKLRLLDSQIMGMVELEAIGLGSQFSRSATQGDLSTLASNDGLATH